MGKRNKKIVRCSSCKESRPVNKKCTNCIYCSSCNRLRKKIENCDHCILCKVCKKPKKPEIKCKHCNSHHTRSCRRGGDDDRPNEVERDQKEEHDPYHQLHYILRPKEVTRLLLFDWDTCNPHLEKNESDTILERLQPRIKAWNKLYGKNATKVSAVAIVIKKFTRRTEDRNQIKEVLNEALLLKKITQNDFVKLTKLIKDKIEE